MVDAWRGCRGLERCTFVDVILIVATYYQVFSTAVSFIDLQYDRATRRARKKKRKGTTNLKARVICLFSTFVDCSFERARFEWKKMAPFSRILSPKKDAPGGTRDLSDANHEDYDPATDPELRQSLPLCPPAALRPYALFSRKAQLRPRFTFRSFLASALPSTGLQRTGVRGRGAATSPPVEGSRLCISGIRLVAPFQLASKPTTGRRNRSSRSY